MGARLLLRLRRLRDDTRGVAAMEMALVAPLLFLLLAGTVELSLYVSAVHRTTQLSSTVMNAIAVKENAQAVHIQAVMDASATITGFDAFAQQGVVVISSVRLASDGTSPRVVWQCRGGGSLGARSEVGSQGGPAALPGAFALDAEDNVIVTEVFFQYRPLFAEDVLKNTRLRKTSLIRPRLGALTSDPGC